MSSLTVREWKRYGHDRLYVSDDAGTKVGFYDRKTGELHVTDATLRYAVLDALAPFLTGEIPAFAHRINADPVPAGHDLADNVAGAAVAEQASQLAPGRFQRLAAKVLGLRTEATSWEAGAKGERIAGRRLERLRSHGWEVLHSVVLQSGADIDHIAIGPGGVFTINTKHHAGARVAVNEDFVRVNGQLKQYVRNSRHEAASASRRLSATLCRPVGVTGVLAFVGAGSLTVRTHPADVLIALGESVDQLLLSRPVVLAPSEVQAVYTVARRAEIWQS